MDAGVWRLVCRMADRSRVRKVPLQGLVPYGESPLSADACLDPTCLADPARFFLEKARVALSDGQPFGPGCEQRVRLNFATSRALLDRIVSAMVDAARAA